MLNMITKDGMFVPIRNQGDDNFYDMASIRISMPSRNHNIRNRDQAFAGGFGERVDTFFRQRCGTTLGTFSPSSSSDVPANFEI